MPLPNNTTGFGLPQFPDFVPFSVVDRDLYEQYVKDFEPYSDYGYTSLYAWSRNQDQFIAELHGNLVLLLQDYQSEDKVVSFIGSNNVDATARTLLEYARAQSGFVPELTLIPEVTASSISDKALQVHEDRDNHDYILSTQAFIDLPGPEFSHTRRKLSQFQRDSGVRAKIETLDLYDLQAQDAIKKLAYQWAFMGTGGSVTAHEEIAAIERLLHNIHALDSNQTIHCLGLYIDDELEGFCIYECQQDYAIVHFIKANVAFNGAADYMMVSTMRHIFLRHGLANVNHEQDLGIAGLRAAKIRYNPSRFLKKYKVSV